VQIIIKPVKYDQNIDDGVRSFKKGVALVWECCRMRTHRRWCG